MLCPAPSLQFPLQPWIGSEPCPGADSARVAKDLSKASPRLMSTMFL